ncbi:hypothetical protein GCM10023195_82900 [Actinoallomurus liliacearum]|uniref:Uncharacterized protein n=1 Tax=Actinoallomurus liliacearum TaxID=1080073 RepID=A0ABP8TX15_9ACTN
MESDLDTVDVSERLIQHDAVSDLGCHRLAYAFVGTAFRYVWTIWVAEQDPYGETGLRLLCEDADDSGVLGDEETRVDENADLLFGLTEEPVPYVAGNGPAVGVGGFDLCATQSWRWWLYVSAPDFRLINAKEMGQFRTVTRVGTSSIQPPSNGLHIHAQAGGYVLLSQAGLSEGTPQDIVHRDPPNRAGWADANTRRP